MHDQVFPSLLFLLAARKIFASRNILATSQPVAGIVRFAFDRKSRGILVQKHLEDRKSVV